LLRLGPERRRAAVATFLRAAPLPASLEQQLVDEVRRCWEGVPLPRKLPDLIDDARVIATLMAIERTPAWSEGPSACGKHMQLASLLPLEGALQKGGAGAIVLTASFGAWEHIPPALARRGYRVGFLDLRPVNRRPERWPVPGPGLDLRVFSSTGYARALVRFLSEPGSILVTNGDECASSGRGHGGLLGRTAQVCSTPFELARRVDVPLLPVFAVREKGGHVLLAEPKLKVFDTGRGDGDVDATASRWLKLVERHARRRPEHYLAQLLIRYVSRYDDPAPLFPDSVSRGESRGAKTASD